MKYLLNEEEYTELINRGKAIKKERKDLIQDLCTQVCNLKPVTPRWKKDDKDYEPEPWGCILNEVSNGYCDCCPVQDVCPYEHKEWSK